MVRFLFNIFIAMWLIDYVIIKRLACFKYQIVQQQSFGQLLRFEHLLTKLGCVTKEDIFTYSVMITLIPIGCLYVAFAQGIFKGFFILSILYTLLIIVILLKKKTLEKQFSKNSYKLYKYMVNQTDAGVLPRDALINLYDVVSDKELKKVLVMVCGAYQLSLNPTMAASVMKKYIHSQEASNFAMFIETIVFESRDKSMTRRLEKMMFNRYFSYLQRETDGVKTKSMIITIILCAIIVVMILVPMYMDVQDALQSIFS
ncbi:MAG: hypothetical protein KAG94_04375 [Clostridiales bacterium]|nr:hypothetical protein [Clostridiales bacterium]